MSAPERVPLARRALGATALAYVFAATWAGFAVVSFFVARVEVAVIQLVIAAAVVGTDETLRRTGRHTWRPHALSALGIVSLVIVAGLTGQARSSAAWYLPLMGLFAAQTAGLRAAIAWTGIGVASLVGVAFWGQAAPVEPLMTFGDFESTLSAIAVSAVALAYSTVARRLYVEQLGSTEQREATVREQARELAEMRDALELAHARAVAAVEAKSRLMARVSHEVRTPLNGLMGLTEILGDAALTPSQAEIVRTLRASAGTLLQLVNDLLDVTQLEEGTLETALEPVRLRDLVGDVLDTFANVAERHGLGFAAVVDARVPPTVMLDGLRVRQILSNLVNNALKFTDRGEVVIRVEGHVEDGVFHARLAVSDTGQGIAKDKLSGLFDAFEQLDDPVQLRRQGSGLGLWIARQLARSLGGDLEVESTPGEGSTFSLSIEVNQAEADPLRESGVAMLGLPVLVIEPHDASRQALVELARHEGIQLTAASSLDDVEESLVPRVVIADMSAHEGGRTPQLEERFADARLVLGVPPSYVGPPPEGYMATTLKPYRASRLRGVLFDVLPQAEPGIEESTARRMRVLVVDDDPTNRMVARMFLERAGQDVELAATAQEAWSALSTEGFDVAFVDLHLPDESGLSLASHVRQELDPTGRLWMIALTAAATEDDRKQCYEAGMDDFVAKPIQVGLFRAALERAGRMSRRRRRMSSSAGAVVAPAPLPSESPPTFEFHQDTFDTLAEALEEDIVPLVAEYIANGQRLLEELHASLTKDPRTAHRAVHTLASGSAMLGAQGTARIARAIEARLHQGDVVSEAELAALERAFADTSARLRAMDLADEPADSARIG